MKKYDKYDNRRFKCETGPFKYIGAIMTWDGSCT